MFFLSIFFSVLFTETGKIFWSFIFPILFILMLLSSFNISFPYLKETFFDIKFLIVSISLIFIFSPSLSLIVSYLFLEPILIASLLITSVAPAGVANIAFSSWVKGKLEENLIITLLSNILSIFVLPFMTFLVLGKFFVINLPNLFLKISILILIPLLISNFMQKYFKTSKIFQLLKNEYLTLIPLFLIFWGVFSNSLQYLNFKIFTLFLAVFVITSLLFLTGFKITKKLGREPKSGALSIGRRNLSLIYIIAFELKQPIIALPAVAWAISQNLLASALIIKNNNNRKRK